MATWGWRGKSWRQLLCERPYRWSTMRGGCRFGQGHAGDCKPGRTYGAGI